MGERALRRLLIIGQRGRALGQAQGRTGRLTAGPLLACKPPMLVIVAVANKNARIAWALLTKGGVYRVPAVTA